MLGAGLDSRERFCSLFLWAGASAQEAVVNKGYEEEAGPVVIKRWTASYEVHFFLLSLFFSVKSEDLCSGTKESLCSSTASERMGEAADGEMVCRVCRSPCNRDSRGSSISMYVWKEFKMEGLCHARKGFVSRT